MKRFFLFLAMLASATMVHAQDDNVMQFFPTRTGAQLVNKTYDATNKLVATTTLTVVKYSENANTSDIQLNSVTVDPSGKQIDRGTIDAYYDNGQFNLRMSNYTLSTDELIKYLSADNELTADFLDYPNPLGSNVDEDMNPVFRMDGGEYSVRAVDDKQALIHVRTYNRQYAGVEDIKTPAGTFHAYKITYTSEVTSKGTKDSKTLNGIEWYTPGAGIVRSEIYDGEALQNYTVLTSLTK